MQDNVIHIGADASTPPYLFVNEDSELEGLEFEFMQALGEVIGIPVQVLATSFSGLVPSLLSGRIDAGMSNFRDTMERQRLVEFVDYTRSADRIMVNLGNPHAISTTNDLCGPGDLTGHNFHGVATTKANSGLRDVFLDAFEELFADGTYDRLLQKWKQPQLAIDAPLISAEGKDS